MNWYQASVDAQSRNELVRGTTAFTGVAIYKGRGGALRRSRDDGPKPSPKSPTPRGSLYRPAQGKIGRDFGRLAFGRPRSRRAIPVMQYTTANAMELKSFATGAIVRQLLGAHARDRDQYPTVAPIMPNDWTVADDAPRPRRT